MRRRLVVLVATAVTLFGLVGVTGPAQAKAPGPNGRIAFGSGSNTTYTINPDGTAKRVLATDAYLARWSPDGSEVATACDACGGIARIVDPDTGASRLLPTYPGIDLGCTVWSPDGSRLACANDTDNTDPSLWGLYTVRSSDGGDLTKVTSIPGIPGDYSPDGMSLSFLTWFPDDVARIYVINLDGTGLTQITPEGTEIGDGGGSWSPTGNKILFSAHSDPDHRLSLWVVNPDGTGLHQLPIPSCGGARSSRATHGCNDPVWSPDGTKIAFTRGYQGGGRLANIYTVNPDGSGLYQVTRGAFHYNAPDWGTHPFAP